MQERGTFRFFESLIRLQGVWHQWIDYRGIEGITRKPVDIGTSDDLESRERKKLVEELERKGYKQWAREKKYGMRWVGTGGIFSAVKRKFGETVRSTKPENMLIEAKRKFWHTNW